ncbi:hypothetical protein ACLOJK_004116 [Asimina triloba]
MPYEDDEGSPAVIFSSTTIAATTDHLHTNQHSLPLSLSALSSNYDPNIYRHARLIDTNY